jgi:hypothetical protein
MMKVGTRVRVSVGAGLDSGREGVIIPKRDVPTDGRGVPQVGGGNYKPMQSHEYAIRDDRGIFTMFEQYLIEVKG